MHGDLPRLKAAEPVPAAVALKLDAEVAGLPRPNAAVAGLALGAFWWHPAVRRDSGCSTTAVRRDTTAGLGWRGDAA